MSRWGFQIGAVAVEARGSELNRLASMVPPRGRGTLAPFSKFTLHDPATLLLTAEAVESESLGSTLPLLYDEESHRVHSDGLATAFILHGSAQGARESVQVDLPPERGQGRLRYSKSLTTNPLIWAPLPELLVLDATTRGGGLLMHSAALATAGGGFLLSGPSGAGKSTISRATAQMEGVRILSDERVVVRPADQGWLLDGTPWIGDGLFHERESIRLRGLILLEKSTEDRLESLSPARALSLLYRCHFPAFWLDGGEARSLANLERLVSEVPAYLLHNRLGGQAPEMLLSELAA